MAEQSIGMPTTGSGDGVAGGYPTARMIAMETKTLSDGVLLTGSLLGMTGTGTNTLTVAEGSAIVDGYFYENTSAASMLISSLANGTYSVIILVNASGTPITVNRSVAGTTVAGWSVRLAVMSAPAGDYLLLGTIQITGATITAITPAYASMYGSANRPAYQVFAQMFGGIATLTAANTLYDLSSYSSATSTGDNILVTDTINNFIKPLVTGLYAVSVYVQFQTGTTGQRTVTMLVGGAARHRMTIAPVATPAYAATTWQTVVNADQPIQLQVSSTIASQSASNGTFTVSRV